MSVEIVTKDDHKNLEQRMNYKIRELRNNMAYVPEPTGPWLMTTEQLEYKLNISRTIWEKAIKEGLLTPIRFSRQPKSRIFFKVEEVKNLIDHNHEILAL